MLTLLYGEDSYRLGKYLADLRGTFCRDNDPSGMNVAVLDASRDGAEGLAEAALTVSFLSPKKLVIARGYLSAAKSIQEAVLSWLDRVSDSTTIVFQEGASAKELSKSPLFERLAKETGSREFVAITARSVGSVFAGELKARGISLGRGAEQRAAALLPADSWQIIQEAEKTSAFASAKGLTTVGVAELEEILVGGKEETIFAFLDSCLDGQPKQAVIQLAQLLDGGMSEHQVLATIIRQVKTLVAVRDCLDHGITDKSQIARELKLHPYPVEKAARSVYHSSSDMLRRLFGLCLDTEAGLKTSRSGRETVEILAVRLAVVSGKR